MTDPLILLGCQRSGTTALAWALSEAYGAAGGHFTVNGKLPYLLDRWCRQDDVDARHLRADEILHALRRRPPGGAGVERWLCQVETSLRRAAADTAAGRARDADELARRILAESYAGFPRWGDKYNEYLLHLPSLLRMLPRARLLLLVRHPTEVAESMLGWSGDRPWRPERPADAVAKWVAWHRQWPLACRTVPAHRRLVVDYHDLCAGAVDDLLSEFVEVDLGAALRTITPRRRATTGVPLSAAAGQLWAELSDQAALTSRSRGETTGTSRKAER
ncbi:sulfotransferase [Micromonospora sp. PLK6-60]|uniref:sulfotransferase n=1 Tax=Micromonospora sp. PLK6-60 TaxID=2873383 RepID=UPI001CA62F48|nr:sulfotransferase [Micromonospora sp. PLK6-60]MBY8870653.1 sulfotransferase [Micromonospora sp. PLK6-60]